MKQFAVKYNSIEKGIVPSIRRRLPGGSIFNDLVSWDNKFGSIVLLRRLCNSLRIFLFGYRHKGRNRVITELKPPFEDLYHLTTAANIESIIKQGLMPHNNYVYLSNRNDKQWRERFGTARTECFQINTELLVKSGHSVYIINRFHEFVTDYVPPECLTLIYSVRRDTDIDTSGHSI